MIKLTEGPVAEIVYRDLSGVAHGNPTAHVRLTEAVPTGEELGISVTEPGTSLRRPVSILQLVVPLRVVWEAYMYALGRKILMYGWDLARYEGWMAAGGAKLERITPPDRD